ncbi:MAG: type II CAAX endopeptidase family protein [Bacteroidota bacterium]
MPDPVLPPFPTGREATPLAEAQPRLAPEVLSPPVPALKDAWPWSVPFRLTGGVERGQFHPVLMAFLVFIGAFLVFNLVGGIIVGVAAVMEGGPTVDMEAYLVENGGIALGANTLGQWLSFALIAALMARWSSPDWREFVRSRTPEAGGLLLASIGWAFLYFFVIWLGQINAEIPLPESLRAFDQMMTDQTEALLAGTDLPPWMLFVAIAITPAVCEELMFRGYLQRQIERGMGLVWSIVLVGVLFGAYHLQVTKLLPLATLGIYLGFVVWATGSVWTGALVHLLNNGFAVLLVTALKARGEGGLEAIEAQTMPWYLGVGGAVLALLFCVMLYRRRQSMVGDAQDAMPVRASGDDSGDDSLLSFAPHARV